MCVIQDDPGTEESVSPEKGFALQCTALSVSIPQVTDFLKIEARSKFILYVTLHPGNAGVDLCFLSFTVRMYCK